MNEQKTIDWLIKRKAAVSATPQRKVMLRERLLSNLGTRHDTSMLRMGSQAPLRWVRAFVAVSLALVIAFAATVSASAGALPGDLLYGVKLGVEDYRLSVTDDPVARSEYLSELIETRLGELERLAVRGDSAGLDATAQRLVLHLSIASNAVTSQSLTAAIAHSQELLLELSDNLPDETAYGLQQALNAYAPTPEPVEPQATLEVTETAAPDGDIPEVGSPNAAFGEVAQGNESAPYVPPISQEDSASAAATVQVTPDDGAPAGHPPQTPPGQSGGSNNGAGTPGPGSGQSNGNGGKNGNTGNSSPNNEGSGNASGNRPEETPGISQGENGHELKNPGKGNKEDKGGED